MSQNGQLLSRRGRSSPANASGFDTHRASITSRFDCSALPNIGAILHAGQPSVQTLGIGDVLFGRPPAGRLIQTIYPKEYADEVAIFGK
eukprot:SAG25_NODE_1555_length_2770_cov_38.636459_4_plen_89_part_00